MQIHELEAPKGARKRRKIVGRGRGSGHGKTSCRGQTGQNSRAGRGILGSLQGGQMPLIRQLPKVGFRSKRPKIYKLITLSDLSRFQAGTVVTAQILKDKGLIKNIFQPYKILGDGEIENALTVQAYRFSKSAVEKITKAGGKVETIDRNILKAETQKNSSA